MSRNGNPGQFPPGKSGNPQGRPVGTRNRATVAVEALFDGEVEEISRKAVELAKTGDLVAIRLVLDRVVPVRKDRAVPFPMPPIDTAADGAKASAAIVAAVADGTLTPLEAESLSRLVAQTVGVIQTSEMADRMERLEWTLANGR